MRFRVILFMTAVSAVGLSAQAPVNTAKKPSSGPASSQASATKASPHKAVLKPPATPVTATPKPAAARTTTRRRTTTLAKNGSKTGSKNSRAPSYHAPQQQPTTDRYREIQQALADKGYFNGPVDGTWGAGSVDALKRFQHDQNITEDGKVGSLSLIALGLGPKRTVASATQTPEKPIQVP